MLQRDDADRAGGHIDKDMIVKPKPYRLISLQRCQVPGYPFQVIKDGWKIVSRILLT